MCINIQSKEKNEYDPIKWIKANVELRQTNAAEALYEHMESQSGRQLPEIYLPFDGKNRGHFADRGQILDFAIVVGSGRVLDFGPGDGWPSLLMAPMTEEVIGVDGSKRRVDVCTSNAIKLGISNVSFVHVPPGESLPFEDNSFDGITAASSIEQTPNVKATLKELCRVVKPSSKLRMSYESLGCYQGGSERDVKLNRDRPTASLMIFDRNIKEEYAQHYKLVFDFSVCEVQNIFDREGCQLSYTNLRHGILTELCQKLMDAETWTTKHPSCKTLLRWLRGAGFSSAVPTYDGGWFAKRLFDRLAESKRPSKMDAIDNLLRPLAEVVVTMDAPVTSQPGEWEPWITAVK